MTDTTTTTLSNTAATYRGCSSEMRDIIINGSHPVEWSEFVGQQKAVRMLKLAAASARARNAVLGNTLLDSRYAGIGKTSLALLIALEMGREFRMLSGKVTVTEFRNVVGEMEPGGILLIDEIHQIASGNRANAEFLLSYLQNGTIIGPHGPEDFPRVTIIGTTTDSGRLPAPVLDRFEYKPPLMPYDDFDATRIAGMLAAKLFPQEMPLPTVPTQLLIANAGANRPRQIKSVLHTLRDLAIASEVTGPEYDLTDVYDMCELTRDGLTAQMQKYLLMLREATDPIGAAQLADRLGEKGTGLAEVELVLIDKGYVARGRRGRELTRAGITRAKELVMEKMAA